MIGNNDKISKIKILYLINLHTKKDIFTGFVFPEEYSKNK
jgi:hypothetical protein